MYSKILNPKTHTWVNINSKNGKNILNKYLELIGGALASENLLRKNEHQIGMAQDLILAKSIPVGKHLTGMSQKQLDIFTGIWWMDGNPMPEGNLSFHKGIKNFRKRTRKNSKYYDNLGPGWTTTVDSRDPTQWSLLPNVGGKATKKLGIIYRFEFDKDMSTALIYCDNANKLYTSVVGTIGAGIFFPLGLLGAMRGQSFLLPFGVFTLKKDPDDEDTWFRDSFMFSSKYLDGQADVTMDWAKRQGPSQRYYARRIIDKNGSPTKWYNKWKNENKNGFILGSAEPLAKDWNSKGKMTREEVMNLRSELGR